MRDPETTFVTVEIKSEDFRMSLTGLMATATYEILAITAECSVLAAYDYGTEGEYWIALPDLFQFPDMVVADTGYTYT